MEGMMHGLLAGFIATGVVWLIFHVFIPHYIPQAGVISWPFGRWYFLVGAMFLVAVMMGFLGSRWASKKFIHRTTVAS